jgi:hypothetical protein
VAAAIVARLALGDLIELVRPVAEPAGAAAKPSGASGEMVGHRRFPGLTLAKIGLFSGPIFVNSAAYMVLTQGNCLIRIFAKSLIIWRERRDSNPRPLP